MTDANAPEKGGKEWVVISLGKIVQFDGRQYGVCYVTHDSAFGDPGAALRGDDGDARVFKRGFTLPDLTLLRCNLFATLLAVEFAMGTLRRCPAGERCVVAVKHRGAYDLVTDPEAISAEAGTSRWPKRLARNKKLIARVVRAVRCCGGAVELSYVEPDKNADGDLEFYANCDRDPLEHRDEERVPEGSGEFQELMRVAREHKRCANDLAEVGRVFPRTRMRKPTKKESTYAAPRPATKKSDDRGGREAGDASSGHVAGEAGAKTKVTAADFDAMVRAFLGGSAPLAQK